MRRLTVAILAVGCLALLVGTISISMTRTVYALPNGATFDQCVASGGDDACDNDHGPLNVRYCHFNEGLEGEIRPGDPHCGNQSSYDAHAGDKGHGVKDFCISNSDDEALCLAGKTPDPK
jgi:hypothetical protein